MKLFNWSDEYELVYNGETLVLEQENQQLAEEGETTPPTENNNNKTDPAGGIPNWVLFVLLGVLAVGFVVWMLFSNRKNKERQKEYTEQLEALAPGNKVKTAGGICGIVVEVCDDNTVILETGSLQSGKSYIKMDKELIAQTDAKGPTQIAREQAEAARKAEKEAKVAEKKGKKEPEQPTEAPEQPETPEQPASSDADDGKSE